MDATYAAGLALAALGGLAFLVAAQLVRARRPASEEGRALGLLLLWAWLAGGYSLVSVAQNAAAEAGWIGARGYLAAELLIGVAGFAGVFSYLAFLGYLATGTHRWRVPALAFAAAGVALLAGLALTRAPIVRVGAWRATLAFDPPLPPLAGAALLAMEGAAPAMGIAVLGRALRVARHDPTRRWRLRLLLVGNLGWTGAVVFGVAIFVSANPLFEILDRLAYLVMAGGMLLAYAPPSWARRRGVESLRDERDRIRASIVVERPLRP